MDALVAAKSDAERGVEFQQQVFFRAYLNLISKVKPLPRRLTQAFHAELAGLKADRKYPEHKPSYHVLHERPTAEQANRHPRGRNSL